MNIQECVLPHTLSFSTPHLQQTHFPQTRKAKEKFSGYYQSINFALNNWERIILVWTNTKGCCSMQCMVTEEHKVSCY